MGNNTLWLCATLDVNLVRAIVKAEEAASASLKEKESKKGDFDTTFRQVSFLPPPPLLGSRRRQCSTTVRGVFLTRVVSLSGLGFRDSGKNLLGPLSSNIPPPDCPLFVAKQCQDDQKKLWFSSFIRKRQNPGTHTKNSSFRNPPPPPRQPVL